MSETAARKGSETSDHAIIATSDDAINAKLSTIETGYYIDPFLSSFVSVPTNLPVQPLIRRGTYARVCCIDRAIVSFVTLLSSDPAEESVQVIVLGSGKDTTFFRYNAGLLHQDAVPKISWFEVDHESVIQQKAAMIERSKVFNTTIYKCEHGYRISDDSTLISYDLRNDPKILVERLKSQGINLQAPTLIINECFQMYMPEDDCQNLYSYLVHAFSRVYLCSYEPILGSDPFGRVMEDNLRRAKMIDSESNLVQVRTLEDYLRRYRSLGLSSVGCDMLSAYETVLTPEQRRNANQCELLDEMEEWMLIMRHYCFVVATNDKSSKANQFLSVGKDSLLGFQQGRCMQMCP